MGAETVHNPSTTDYRIEVGDNWAYYSAHVFPVDSRRAVAACSHLHRSEATARKCAERMRRAVARRASP